MGLPTPEEQVADNLERLRTEAGLTYEGLAQKLMGMGIRIHPSAIQKTEKSGRKATIKEMLAYSRLFNIPVQQLWGGYAASDDVIAAQRDLAAAEKILKIQRSVRDEYQRSVKSIAELALKDRSVRREIEGRVMEHATQILLVAAKERHEDFGVSIFGWEHAVSLLPEDASIPVELETAIDCLQLVRQMEGEPDEPWESRAEREAALVNQTLQTIDNRERETGHGE